MLKFLTASVNVTHSTRTSVLLTVKQEEIKKGLYEPFE